jgi:hypothetical protein
MKSVKFLVIAMLAAAGMSVSSAELVRDGRAQCPVVIKPDAPPPVRFGAQELAKYLKKITGADLSIVKNNAPDQGGIYVGTLSDAELVKKANFMPSRLKEDGFAMIASGRNVYVIGQNPRGALYGCYHLLKKYGGVRWLVPGDDEEYYRKKTSVAVPEGTEVQNPYLKIRKTVADELTAFRWLARNNMLGQTRVGQFVNRKTGKRTPNADRMDELAVTGAAYGGHVMTYLMANCSWKQEPLKALFKSHPEYFPLISGERRPMTGGFSPNPCVSDPGLLDLLAENLYKETRGKYGSQHYIILGNNDTPVWCECKKCRALDDPAMEGTKGARSDRYWYMVTEVAKRVWKKDPAVMIAGWAYQDFWYPPARVKIDPRIAVMISYNHQCWRHSITDPACSVNGELRKIMRMWKKTGHPLIYNRDEIGAYDGGGSPGVYYLPSEKVLFDNFKAYKDLGFAGSSFCVNSPFSKMSKKMKNAAPYYGKNLFWYAMWQICYLSSLSMWDPDYDFAKEYETINALYYGKAWEGGFKEFRMLLTKYFTETPGCMGWGLGAPLGRCLDQAGSEEKLLALLEKAIAAAKTDPDPRVLKHVLRDKEIFLATWIKARREYLANFRELNVYRRTVPIKIDGVLEEPDWKNADVLTGFKPGGMTKKTVKVQQSYVRVTYDTDTLYIAVECMEPQQEKIVAGKTVPHDDKGWAVLGNSVELFYNYPDMAERYYHLAINSNGQVIDARHGPGWRDAAFRTSAKIATQVLKDRWILEIAIPASEIGMKCYDGATWKLNVARQRKISDPASPTGILREGSSCSNGAFHGVQNFVNMKFTPKRVAGLRQNADMASWKNPDFNNAVPDSKRPRLTRFKNHKGWQFTDEKELVPAVWRISADAEGSYQLEGEENYYIRLTRGYISQYFIPHGRGKLKISFQIRGKGSFHLWTCSYRDKKERKAIGYDILKTTQKYQKWNLTPEWKTYHFETAAAGVPTERVAVRFTVHRNSVLELDNVYVSPVIE